MSETEFRAAAHTSGFVPNTLKALIEKDSGKIGASSSILALTELIKTTISTRSSNEVELEEVKSDKDVKEIEKEEVH
jgi:hypothetical protein